MSINKRLDRVRNTIVVRSTKESDIPLILSWENKEQYVSHWSREDHLNVILDQDMLHHTIIVKSSGEPVGYAILKNGSPDKFSLEFIRLVICNEHKSRGYGFLYFEYIWDLVFSKPGIERIWHDVFARNHYAVRLYEKLGYTRFKEEEDTLSGRVLYFYELTKCSYLSKIAR